MIEIRYRQHIEQADLAGRSVAEVRQHYKQVFDIPDRAKAILNGKPVEEAMEPRVGLLDGDKLSFEVRKRRRTPVLLGALVLALVVGGVYIWKAGWPGVPVAPPEAPVAPPEARVAPPQVGVATLEKQIRADPEQPWVQPAALTVVNGRTFVLDTGNGRVIELGTEGEVIDILDQSLDEQLELLFPMAMTAHQGKLYIANSLASQIIIIDPSERAVKVLELEKTESSDERLPRPIGLAVTPAGNIVVSDADNHRLLLYDGDGQLLRFIGAGERAGGEYRFNVPAGVEVDGAGNVFVVDMLNGRVMKYSAEGGFLQQFGEPGDTVGTFSRPKDVAIDDEGRVYVSDGLLRAVQVFDSNGQYLYFIGRKDPADVNSDSLFSAPADIEIVGDKLYVIDRFQGLFVFHLLPSPPIPTPAPTTTTPAEKPAPAAEEPAVTEGPPNIPAGHATSGCPMCHEQGIGGATKWPDDHAGFTEQMCTSCHQPAG